MVSSNLGRDVGYLDWFCRGFPESLQENAGIVLRLGHKFFLANPFQFMLPSCYSTPNEYSLGTDDDVKYPSLPKKYSHNFPVHNYLTILSLDTKEHKKLKSYTKIACLFRHQIQSVRPVDEGSAGYLRTEPCSAYDGNGWSLSLSGFIATSTISCKDWPHGPRNSCICRSWGNVELNSILVSFNTICWRILILVKIEQ
jgi:hypothetical protein